MLRLLISVVALAAWGVAGALPVVARAQLPKGIVVEKVEAAPEEEDAPAAPYLSLNIDGHTASIKAISFSPDSQTLYTAGQDKVVHAWRYHDGRAKAFVVEPVGWRKSHSIRWEIARSIRGSIYGLAVSPGGGTVAIAGFGARGTAGDIVLADAADGTIESVARGGHGDSVFGLSYSSDGRWMVSTDLRGKSVLWDVTRTPPTARVLQQDTRIGSSCSEVFAGRSHLLVRRFKELKKAGGRSMATFEIDYHNVNTGRSDGRAPITLYADITALAASRDGRYLAVCDAARRLYVYKTGDTKATKLLEGQVARSLCFSPDGRYLAVGTMAEGGASPQVHLWDTMAKKRLFARALQRSVISVALSPNGRWLACNGGESHHVFVWEFDGHGRLVNERARLLTGGDRIVSVQPTPRDGGFRARIVTNTGEQRIFDPVSIDDDPLAVIPKARAMVVESVERGDWNLESVGSRYRLQLFQGGAKRGFIDLDPLRQGGLATPDSYCFIPDEFGRPIGVAVGTDTSNEIFVYDLPAAGECAIVRRFRGHMADVTALSITGDRRYLVSGSADGTVRYWKLAGLSEKTFIRRWGAEVAIADDGVGLKVTRCSDSGPLFQKGVRAGDVIAKIVWPESETGDGRTLGTVDPKAMYRELQAQPWSKQFGMDVRRGDELLDRFNVVSGWHHLLAVYIHNGEWIAWHPSGYYACSPGGNGLIGWQVNEDIGDTPKLFPAVRFHKSLYRPKEVSNLLVAGGLARPDVAVSRPPPPPLVELTAPVGRRVEHDAPTIVVRARAKATGDQPLISMQLLINGVPAVQHTKAMAVEGVDRRDRPMDWVEREWTVDLEPGEHTIAVRADTVSSHAYSTSARIIFQPARAKRTLHLLAIAVNEYADDGVSDLRFCVKDSQRIAEIFQNRGAGLFDDVRITTIYNEQATRKQIEAAFESTAQAAGMNDLVVLFYSGHGHRVDDRFFMVAHDANLDNLKDRGVPEVAIKQFCQQVAAKGSKMMIMIDACRSGAMRLERLIADLATDDFRVAMMASSKGDEFSYEHNDFGGGAFTQALWLGMHDGEADTPGVPDRRIDNDELGRLRAAQSASADRRHRRRNQGR